MHGFFNRKLVFFLFGYILLFSGCQLEETSPEQFGEVTLKQLGIEVFSQAFDNARFSESSSWNHLHSPTASIEFQNISTGQKYSMSYEPGNFNKSYSISLPFGQYTFRSEVLGGLISDFLPYSVEGSVYVNQATQEISMQANTDYGLITLKNELVSEAVVKVGDVSQALSLLSDGSYYYAYIKGGQTATLVVKETYGNQILERNISVQPYLHRNFILEVTEGSLGGLDLVMDEFLFLEEVIIINDDTILPPWLNPNKTYGILMDIDGNVYRTIQIGTQTWMAENLKTTKYCNGDEIPEGKWVYYNNDPIYNEVYGKLYTSESVTDERGICPCGWHVPKKAEWDLLQDYSDKIGRWAEGLKSVGTEYWKAPNEGATNSTGFSAMPGGGGSTGDFHEMGERAYFWSIFPTHLTVNYLAYDTYWMTNTGGPGGASIRCVKD